MYYYSCQTFQYLLVLFRGCRDRMVVGFTNIYVKSVPITTKVVSSNHTHSEVYSMQHYVVFFLYAQLSQLLCNTRKTQNINVHLGHYLLLNPSIKG
jgi:hypothetical protein